MLRFQFNLINNFIVLTHRQFSSNTDRRHVIRSREFGRDLNFRVVVPREWTQALR